MDWGIFRDSRNGFSIRMIRPKKLYPVWFYKFAVCTNTILRLFWLIQLVPYLTTQKWAVNPQFTLTILGIGEGLRRMQWTLIRVENENVNNFE
jgi:hypothetical protein